LWDNNAFGAMLKAVPTSGGLHIAGLKDAGAGQALVLEGLLDSTADTGKTTSDVGVVCIDAAIEASNTRADVGAEGNLVAIRNNGTARFFFDAEGDFYCDAGGGYGNSVISGSTVSGYNTYDDYDDIALLNGLRASLAPPGHELRSRFADWIEYARPVLERNKVVVYNDGPEGDGRAFKSVTGLQMLTIDALRQFAAQTMARLDACERALLSEGIEIPMIGEG